MEKLNSIRKIKERVDNLEKIGKNPYKRILMEKEKQGVTYEELAEKVEGLESDALRKMLTNGTRVDYDIVKRLNEALGIQEELDNNEAVAVYHYTQNRPAHVGRVSNEDKLEKQKLYVDAQQRKSERDKGEYSIDELLLDWKDRSDADEYCE